MKKIISLKSSASPDGVILLDTERGLFITQPGGTQLIEGNYANVEGEELGIFAADKKLYLQWGSRRWEFSGLAERIRYEHDFQQQVTTFSIDDVSIRYPAWWANDPTFDPSIPERDEDEDFFAYIASVARSEKLQSSLIQRWDR